MASSARIVVTGHRAIDRKLRALGAKGANAIARRAMRESMKAMLAAVKAEEPIGETGDLARKVKLRAGKRSRGGMSVAVALDDKSFPDAYYAAFRELGTEHMPADPAMRRAFDANEAAVKARAMALLWRGIKAALR